MPPKDSFQDSKEKNTEISHPPAPKRNYKKEMNKKASTIVELENMKETIGAAK